MRNDACKPCGPFSTDLGYEAPPAFILMTQSARRTLEHELQSPAVPRIGFLGTGWIGRHRLRAIAARGVATVAAVADLSEQAVRDACGGLASTPRVADSLDALLEDNDLDGIVISTPNAVHAEQALTALERGVAVFCQHPIGRTAMETRRVVDTARANDRLLSSDLAYRFTSSNAGIREIVRRGELGDIFAVDVAFHTPIGPDRHWFQDVAISGDGCVLDLGSHVLDLALWMLDYPALRSATSRVYANGKPLRWPYEEVEDFAVARLDLETGACIQLTCAWDQPSGRQAVISATFQGTRGIASFQNIHGSYYEFVAEHYFGSSREAFAEPDADWAGRGAVDWARRLAAGVGYDPSAARLIDLAAAIDRIYGR